MSDRRARGVGIALAAMSALLALTGLWLAWGPGGRPIGGLVHDNTLNNGLNGVWMAVLATAVLRSQPRNRIGWLVLAVAWANTLTILGGGWALASYHLHLPARSLLAWWGAWPWAPALLIGTSLVLLIYPTGRTTTRSGHRLAVASLVSAAGLVVGMALLDAPYRSVVAGHDLGHNPISHGHAQPVLLVVTGAAALVGALVAVLTWGHTATRLWRARSPEREQLAWLMVGIVPTLAAAPLNSPWVELVVNALAPVALAFGILRYQLFDIKLVLRSGLVYGSLTVLSVGAYFAVVAVITMFTPQGPVPTLFAVATVGLLVVPTHRRLQRFFGRLVYGDRGDPIRAFHRIGEGMRAAGDEGLSPMLTGIAEALRSPRVAVVVDGEEVAVVGAVDDGHPVHHVALDYAGRHVGELVVASRTERDRLGRTDRGLLTALGGPVAAAVDAARAARELTESRARVLGVREAERTRLRADLHDGVGPSLSGVSLGLEAAIRALDTSPDRVPEILGVVHREVDCLVAEVRSIIDDLGPADLDLLGALRSQVEAVASSGLAVHLRHDGLPISAPPAVLVAAQRIAGEALSNAVRHAAASCIEVCVRDERDTLVVVVEDDGCGTPGPRPGGVGLSSMRERAAAVGGVLDIESTPGGGTVVRAVLPSVVTA